MLLPFDQLSEEKFSLSRRLLFFFTLYTTCLFFSSCHRTVDLSHQEPYSEAIGKKFVLQQDLYIYTFRKSTHLYLGNAFGLPNKVDQKYIKTKYSDGFIIGIAQVGQTIEIDQFLEEYAPLASSSNYCFIKLIDKNVINFGQLDATDLVNIKDNPPYTKTWGDPPIFNPKYALPLPSEGVWWK